MVSIEGTRGSMRYPSVASSKVDHDDNSATVEIHKFARRKGYRISASIGVGGFSEVYRAARGNDSTRYAMKAVRKTEGGKVNAARLMAEEAESLRTFSNCPYIVRLVEYIEDDENAAIIMELMRGGDLHELYERNIIVSDTNARKLFRRVLLGLDYIHSKRRVHGDMKPDNIAFASPGQYDTAKLIDFGFCGDVIPCFDRVGTIMPNSIYSPPEVLSYVNRTEKADIWGVGLCATMALTGMHPFVGDECFVNGVERTDSADKIATRVLDNEYATDPYTDPRVSSEARDFIRSCLEFVPFYRPSAMECLAMPWLSNVSASTITERCRAHSAPPGMFKCIKIFS